MGAMTTTLRVIDEETSAQLGAIVRADDDTVQASGLAQAIFEQIREGKGWNDIRTFEELLDGGWSNGYVSIRAE